MVTPSADREPGAAHLAGPAYYQTRRDVAEESPAEVRRMYRQLRRWDIEGTLGPNARDGLWAVADELRARGLDLPEDPT